MHIGITYSIYIDSILGVSAAVFSLGLTYPYNRFAPEILEQEAQATKEDKTAREHFATEVDEQIQASAS